MATTQMSDKSYLEQHHELLETLMSQCIHELLKSKPASPVAFISSFFARQAAAAPLLTTQTADEMALPTNQEQESTSSDRPARHSAAAMPSLVTRAAEAALAVPVETTQHAHHEQEWSAAAWISSLDVGSILAEALLAPVREQPESEAPSVVELTFVRRLGDAETGGCAAVTGLLRHSSVLERLGEMLWRGVSALSKAKAATGLELHQKFLSSELIEPVPSHSADDHAQPLS
mgnify:CR=1 FL=1